MLFSIDDWAYNWGMEKVFTRSVDELPPAEKRSLEGMIGGSLDQGQRVFIMAFTPGATHDEETRRQAHAALLQTMDEIKAHQDADGITEEQIDAAANKAIEHSHRHRNG